MRLVLFTGKGGVGKTTAAAATAALAAGEGRKALAVSADPARSLAEVLGVSLGAEPVDVAGPLSALQVEPQRACDDAWPAVRDALSAWWDTAGFLPPGVGLAGVPAVAGVLTLLAIRDAARSANADLICVDCASTAETVRLLQWPELITAWLQRLLPRVEGALVRGSKSLLNRALSMPAQSEALRDALTRLDAELADAQALLADPLTTSVRLVLTPERSAVAHTRRALTALALHGHRVDGLILNRVLAPDGADPWRAGWAAAQQEQLAVIRADFGALPIWEMAYGPAEPLGVAALADLARGGYGGADPLGGAAGRDPLVIRRTPDGFALELPLPWADRSELDLARYGDDLLVRVGAQRRTLHLPAAVRGCQVAGARLADGVLTIRFQPGPERRSGG
ncbi:MAG TPA: ArsA family ATPase [Mycobacteriales bacterium]|nr:ArsA family ATPase [Mycobacteriales bacterium]